MKCVLQRVAEASVSIDGRCVARISRGLLVLTGIAPEDDQVVAKRMLERILGYRIFNDDNGRMNRNVVELGGGVLLVPNFTLMADTRKGMRPSFTGAAAPEMARELFEWMCVNASQQHPDVAYGVFGADMQVALINDGPITITLTS